MAKRGVGEWVAGPGRALAGKPVAEVAAAKTNAEVYGLEALFGIHSGPPAFYHGRDKDGGNCMDLELLTLSAYLSPAENGVKRLEIRSRKRFNAISRLGHVDVLSAANARTIIDEARGTGRTMTKDAIGSWEGPGPYFVATFPLRSCKPPTLKVAARENRRGGGGRRVRGEAADKPAGYSISRLEFEPSRRRGGGGGGECTYSATDVQPLTKWIPGEKAYRKGSAREAFAQAMLSREAAGLLETLTPQRCHGAGLWHFLAVSGERQPYAMALLTLLEARDVALLEKGQGEEVARVLAASLRGVVPPPDVGAGATLEEAMEALDEEIDTFVQGCYLELLRSLYSVPPENLQGKTPADLVPNSSMHADLWSNVWCLVPNSAKGLRVELRDTEHNKRVATEAAVADGRRAGGTPLWWTALLSGVVLASVAVFMAMSLSYNPVESAVLYLVGGWLPEAVLGGVCALLSWVNWFSSPLLVVLFFDTVFSIYGLRPPAAGTDSDGKPGSLNLGAALLWRANAARGLSRRLFASVAVLLGMTPPARRSREELARKCRDCVLVWGMRQVFRDMSSAVRRGHITKAGVLQLADGIAAYRAEQEEAAAAEAAPAAAAADGIRRGTNGLDDNDPDLCERAAAFPGSIEEAEAFLGLPVVADDAGASAAGARGGGGGDGIGDAVGESWFDSPLPGSALEGALNMAVFAAAAGATGLEEQEAALMRDSGLSLASAEGSGYGGSARPGSGRGSGDVGFDPRRRADVVVPDDDDDSGSGDDDEDDGNGLGTAVSRRRRQGQSQQQKERKRRQRRRRRCMPTQERSHRHTPPGAPAAEVPRTKASMKYAKSSRRRSSGGGGGGGGGTEQPGQDGADALNGGGGAKGTVRALLEKRGWRFGRQAGSVAFTRIRAASGRVREAAVARFVASKTFYHDSVGVGSQWTGKVEAMMLDDPRETVGAVAVAVVQAAAAVSRTVSLGNRLK
ncbi:unnamed protein product [Scytosiphon promiscuus]